MAAAGAVGVHRRGPEDVGGQVRQEGPARPAQRGRTRRHPAQLTTPRERVIEATYACIARYGIAKTTVEDVARQAKLSRATVYRYFPGGKEQLVNATIAWEAGRFFERLAAVVGDAGDLESQLVAALMHAHRAVEEHEVLQKVLETEPERLLPQLTVESTRLIAFIRTFLHAPLARERDRGRLVRGLDLDRAADHVARLVLSFVGSPGAWDLTDADQVRELVRTQLLAGVVRADAGK